MSEEEYLDWKKGEDYSDKFAEAVNVTGVIVAGVTERSKILDFGVVESEGMKGSQEGLERIKPYIKHHTRIRVSPEHFETIVKILNEELKEMKKEKEEENE